MLYQYWEEPYLLYLQPLKIVTKMKYAKNKTYSSLLLRMDFVKAIASTVIGIVMADVVTGLIDPKEQHQQEHQLGHFTRDGMNKDITNILSNKNKDILFERLI